MKKTSKALTALVATMLCVTTVYASTNDRATGSSSKVIITVGQPKSLAKEQNTVYLAAKQLIQHPPHNRSFDTPGFVQYVYSKINMKLPRTILDQSRLGEKILNRTQLQKDDLVFFNLVNSGSDVTFVGIYLEKNMVAALTTHGLMEIDMKSQYWSNKFRFGARLL